MFFQQHTCGLMLKRFLILKNNLLDVLVAEIKESYMVLLIMFFKFDFLAPPYEFNMNLFIMILTARGDDHITSPYNIHIL